MSLALSIPRARQVEIVDLPARDPGPDEVRLAVRRCGICGSDLHWYTGHQQPPEVCPGHEISAEVEAVGRDAGAWREGDRVAVEPLLRCGRCDRCRAGNYHLCRDLGILGVTHPGGMAERLVARAEMLHPLPDAVDFELGALAEPMAVAVHALRLARLGEDEKVLVLGAGTIGLVAIVAARHLGAGFIGATGRYAHQRLLATNAGADQVIAPEDLGSLEQRPRVVVETVGGQADTISDGVRRVTRGGTVVMLGLFERTPVFDPLQLLVKEVRLVGSNVYNHPSGDRSDFDIALEILTDRPTAIRPLVTHTLGLRDAARAFETASDKSTGAVKVLIDPTA
jgi:(R,R)-butanediol dehydrogenase/meso-butanediol dehydrogenase/diacetyl reductase